MFSDISPAASRSFEITAIDQSEIHFGYGSHLRLNLFIGGFT